MSFLLFSCSETGQGDIVEIPVDIDQNSSLPLSEIVDELIAMELELTDESMINPDRIKRVLLCEDYVIIAEMDKILVFGKNGKYVRPIGTRGQGPGEYSFIRSVAVDEKNRRLFVNSDSKIICFDWEGKYIREFRIDPGWSVTDMNYINMDSNCLQNKTQHKQACHENKLSGKLKELVATLNEDEDNNVFMLVHCK